MKHICILGSTGSIGTSTLSIIERYPERFAVAALVAGRNLDLAFAQCQRWRPLLVSMSTEQLAGELAARLKAAGFGDADVQVFSPAPRKGNLVARLHGSGARKPILLVAHLDVVPALRSDWTVDPFKLTEQDGYYYARGSSDDKYMAASFIANLIRYKQEGYKPDRDIIVALETDEEILDHDGLGIQWLIKNHRDLIDAEFALNEGGGVGLKDGKAIRNSVQTSEKFSVR